MKINIQSIGLNKLIKTQGMMIKKLGHTLVRFTSKLITCSGTQINHRSVANVTFLQVPRNDMATDLMSRLKTSVQNNCYINQSPVVFLTKCHWMMVWKLS